MTPGLQAYNAMSNSLLLRLHPFGSILERLDGTVAQVSKLRQFLGDLETELGEIRQQFEIGLQARATAVAANEAQNEDGYAIVYNPSGPVSPQGLERPELKRGLNPDPVRKKLIKKSKQKGRSPSLSQSQGSKSVAAETVTKGGSSFRWKPVSRSWSRVTSALSIPDAIRVQLQQPPRPPTPMVISDSHDFYDVEKPPTPDPIQFQQPSTKPPPFPKDVDISSYRPELKHEGDHWFVLSNLSPKANQVLDVSLVHTLLHGSEVVCVKFSQDGKRLATGCRGTAWIYDVEMGAKSCGLDHGDVTVWSVCFSPDGKYLATGGEDYIIRIWDIANLKFCDGRKYHRGIVHSIVFSPDSRYIISGSGDGTVHIWDLYHGTSKVLTALDGHYLPPGKHIVWSVAISPDGKYVVVGSAAAIVTIWEVETGVLVQTLRGHTGGVSSVVFTPDGKGLISGSWDATLKCWDVSGLGIGFGSRAKPASPSGTFSSPCLMNLTKHENPVFSTAVSHDGTWLVSGSKDQNVLFWDTRTGVAQCMLSGHQDTVWQVDLSSKGNFLATASLDRQVRIWKYEETR